MKKDIYHDNDKNNQNLRNPSKIRKQNFYSVKLLFLLGLLKT